MQGSLWWRGAIVALLMGGCAGDAPVGGTRTPGGSSPGSLPGGGGTGGGAAAGTGSFGNPQDPAPNVGGGPAVAPTDPMAAGAGGPCVVGQFCAPTAPDPDDCGTIEFQPDVQVTRTPGNLLVLFDQSGSMGERWQQAGGQTKLQVAQNALVQALMPLQDLMTVGAIFFPTLACIPFLPPPPGGSVQPIEGQQQIRFQPGPQFLQSWAAHWQNRPLGDNIGTPMQEAFDRADVAIQNATLTGPLAVVAFTDGQPNCFPDPAITMVPTMTEPQRAAGWLSSREIKTYMVGLPGAQGVQILNQVAQSGGTMQYIVPTNASELETKLREIVQEQVSTGFNSCSMNLNPVPDLPDELLMIVDEPGVGVQQVPRDRGWGLTVSNGAATIDISGGLCDAAMGGRFSSITFKYACPESPPPPALPPVE
jgi:hypothetical protein